MDAAISGNQVGVMSETGFGFAGEGQAAEAWGASGVAQGSIASEAEIAIDFESPGQASMPLAPVPAAVAVKEEAKEEIKERYERYHTTPELVRIFSTTSDAQRRDGLFAVMQEMVNEFAKQPVKTSEQIQEMLALAACTDKKLATDLFNAFLKPIKGSSLMSIELLKGLSKMIGIAPKENLSETNLVKILRDLIQLLKSGHRASKGSQENNALLQAVGLTLDVMVDQKIGGISEEGDWKPSMEVIKPLAEVKEDDLTVEKLAQSYWASYVLQGLRRTPKSDPDGMAALRKGLLVLEIFGSVASLVASHGTDLSAVLTIVSNFQELISSVSTIVDTVQTVAEGIGTLAEQVGQVDLQGAIATFAEVKAGIEEVQDGLDALQEQAEAHYDSLKQGLEKYSALLPKGKKVPWYRAVRAGRDMLALFASRAKPVPEEFKGFLDQLDKEVFPYADQKRHCLYGLLQGLLDLLAETKSEELQAQALEFIKHQMMHPVKEMKAPVQEVFWEAMIQRLLELIVHGTDKLSINVRKQLLWLEGKLQEKAKDKAKGKRNEWLQKALQKALRDYGVDRVASLKAEGPMQKARTFTDSLLTKARKEKQALEYRIDEFIFKDAQQLRRPGTILHEDLALYVPLKGKVNVESSEVLDMAEAAKQFLAFGPRGFVSDTKVLLLQGAAGGGKSLFLRQLEQNLWRSYHPGRPIPLFISLPTLANPTHHAIEQVLQSYGCSPEEIREFKTEKEYSFVFLLDGFDEIRTEKNLYQENQLGAWNARVIITCRSEYLAGKSYTSFFSSGSSGTGKSLEELMLLPFGDPQIDEYLRKLAANPNKRAFETADGYRAVLNSVHGLNELIQTPFILSMITQVLPQLEKAQKDRKASGQESVMTRALVYRAFVQQWFERQEEKLRGNSSLAIPEGYEMQGSFHAYCQDLAYRFFMTDKTAFEERGVSYSVQKLAVDEWARFSATKEENLRVYLARQGGPLRKIGTQVSFIHKSLLEYFVATLFAEDLEQIAQGGEKLSLGIFFNQKAVNEEPSIILFLVDLIKEKERLRDACYDLIEWSKKEPQVGQAAANAVTVLNWARECLGGQNWAGVRLPGADLSHALLADTDFTGADLRGASLVRGLLRGVKLMGADLQRVKFGQFPTLKMEGLGAITAMALHPEKPLVAVAQDKVIILINQETGKQVGEALRGHEGEVTSVAFSSDGRLLASGSWDKTVRLWDVLKQLCIQVIQWNGEIYGIALFPKARKDDFSELMSLAIGDANGCITFWEITRTGEEIRYRLIGMPSDRGMQLDAGEAQFDRAKLEVSTQGLLEEYGAKKPQEACVIVSRKEAEAEASQFTEASSAEQSSRGSQLPPGALKQLMRSQEELFRKAEKQAESRFSEVSARLSETNTTMTARFDKLDSRLASLEDGKGAVAGSKQLIP